MRPNELMIGDIVKQVDSDLIIQVTAIYGNYIQGKKEDGEYKADTIEPVPLTEEILKANGWQKNDPRWVSTLRRYCDKYGSEWSLSFTLQKGIWDAYIHNRGDLNINKFHPMYVHELQHALRICGLTDLADNFKIS